MIVILVVGIVLILVGLFFLFKALKIKSETINGTEKEIEKYRKQILELQKQQREKVVEIEDLEDKIDLIQTRIISLQNQEKEIQKQIDDTIKNKQQHIEEAEKKFKQNSQNALSQYEETLDQAYNLKEKEIYDRIDQLKNEQAFYVTKKSQAQNELDQIKSSIQAATAARLAQEEESNKWMFYTLDLTNDQMKDIVELNVWKSRISDPSLVAKVIWSAFVLKATNELCNRILGTTKKCGIYKITNHDTQQVYIGQSVNVGA